MERPAIYVVVPATFFELPDSPPARHRIIEVVRLDAKEARRLVTSLGRQAPPRLKAD